MKKIGLLLILLSIINCENKESKSQTKIEETSEVIESTDIFEATKNGNFNDVQQLISKGANINAETENGDMMGTTPLMIASSEGHIEIVQYLIKKGTLVNATNKDGKTALDIARDRNSTEVVEYLEIIK